MILFSKQQDDNLLRHVSATPQLSFLFSEPPTTILATSSVLMMS